MRRLIVLATTIWSCALSAAPIKLHCLPKEIQRRDCILRHGSFEIRLLADSVAWNDGTWRSVDAMPLKGEGVTWEKARFDIMGGRPVLQLWIWDKGTGAAVVQSLNWFTGESNARAFKVLASGVVRKRRLQQSLEPSGQPKFIYDAWEPHALKPLKDGRLEWTLGRDKKILERN